MNNKEILETLKNEKKQAEKWFHLGQDQPLTSFEQHWERETK